MRHGDVRYDPDTGRPFRVDLDEPALVPAEACHRATLADLLPPRTFAETHDARAFLRDCLSAFGPGFHPDTPGADYVRSTDAAPTFTAAEAEAFDRNLDAAVALCDARGVDIYWLASEEWDDADRVGIPYARALDDGGVRCPACGEEFHGLDEAQETFEDATTKGAVAAYGEHYQRTHQGGN